MFTRVSQIFFIYVFSSSFQLLLYQQYGTVSVFMSVFLLVVAGFLVNGPYALITTSVSAELGQHSSLEGNSKALATVTAIIDGTGSIGKFILTTHFLFIIFILCVYVFEGAAVGPLMAGMISINGWQDVFYMLILSDFIAMIMLVRLVKKEFQKLRRSNRIRIE